MYLLFLGKLQNGKPVFLYALVENKVADFVMGRRYFVYWEKQCVWETTAWYRKRILFMCRIVTRHEIIRALKPPLPDPD